MITTLLKRAQAKWLQTTYLAHVFHKKVPVPIICNPFRL